MRRKTKIMVVDDSVVARRMIGDILRDEADFDVVGTAANGRIALAKIPILSPDVITLDVDMPQMDGMEMLASLRDHHPDIRVLMVSGLTLKGAKTTVDALLLGASDYITKTSGADSPEQARSLMQGQLVPKIRALMRFGSLEPPARRRPAPSTTAVIAKAPRVEPRVVAIGASTGGPNALVKLLQHIPADFPVPILIVQHMPEDFTSYLARRLNDRSRIAVGEPSHRTVLEPGRAWIAPGNLHMAVKSTASGVEVRLRDGPLVNSCRPSVDVLFQSIAEAYGPAALGVVLTGMGQDGLSGCEALREAGARIIVQDRPTSVVWGMPGYVAEAGLADKVLPIDDMGIEVTLSVRRRRR